MKVRKIGCEFQITAIGTHKKSGKKYMLSRVVSHHQVEGILANPDEVMFTAHLVNEDGNTYGPARHFKACQLNLE